MDELKTINRKVILKYFVYFSFINTSLIAASFYLIDEKLVSSFYLYIFFICLSILINYLLVISATNFTQQPFVKIWQSIVHLNSSTDIAMPDLEKIKYGKEVVKNLYDQVLQLSATNQQLKQNNDDLSDNFVAKNLPISFLALDSNENIIYANQNFANYIGMKIEEIINKNFYMLCDMSFPSDDTLDIWLKDVKQNRAVANNSWERVRLDIRDNHPMRLFDLSAYFNNENPLNITTMIVLFDHTKQYSQDDQAISFVALSVHELRTPLTLLRGYIEVLQEDLNLTDNSPLKDYLTKMDATAQQLTAFINNILNVARIDDDQLQLKLQPEVWSDTLNSAVQGIHLRAQIRDIKIDTKIEENLPLVGIDKLSIYEVISNLIDNAIKYSGQGKIISIKSYLNTSGFVETSVQDFGLGISANILPNLFTKYYRDHHNRAQIGGTGLGLYLSKSIISAHQGNIWVSSKEGEGTTFYFTLLPYDKLSTDLKNNSRREVTTTAHGWIKNHSLYRR